jgi:hypothetical protein
MPRPPTHPQLHEVLQRQTPLLADVLRGKVCQQRQPCQRGPPLPAIQQLSRRWAALGGRFFIHPALEAGVEIFKGHSCIVIGIKLLGGAVEGEHNGEVMSTVQQVVTFRQ